MNGSNMLNIEFANAINAFEPILDYRHNESDNKKFLFHFVIFNRLLEMFLGVVLTNPRL